MPFLPAVVLIQGSFFKTHRGRYGLMFWLLWKTNTIIWKKNSNKSSAEGSVGLVVKCIHSWNFPLPLEHLWKGARTFWTLFTSFNSFSWKKGYWYIMSIEGWKKWCFSPEIMVISHSLSNSSNENKGNIVWLVTMCHTIQNTWFGLTCSWLGCYQRFSYLPRS